jgi:hypothetical protein
MNLEDLKKPFPACDIDWRPQSAGKSKSGNVWALVLAYVDARAVMDRLDQVCGAEKWKDEYIHEQNGVICKLSIKVETDWITKVDGSPETAIESFKGGISKALVRCAVKWGVGRYLYNLDVNMAKCSLEKPSDMNGWKSDTLGKKFNFERFYWQIPTLPSWALPDKSEHEKRVNEIVCLMREVYGHLKGEERSAQFETMCKCKSPKELLQYDLDELNEIVKDINQIKELSKEVK